MIASLILTAALAQQPVEFFCSDTVQSGFIERVINTAVDRAAGHARTHARIEQKRLFLAAAEMLTKLAGDTPSRESEIEFFAGDEPQFVNVIEDNEHEENTPTEPPEIERLRARVRELEAENEQLRAKCKEQSILVERYKPREVPAKQVDEFAEPGEPRPGGHYRRGPDGKLYRIRGYPNAGVASQPVPSPDSQDGVIVESQPRPRGFLLPSLPAAGGCLDGRCRLRMQ